MWLNINVFKIISELEETGSMVNQNPEAENQ